MRKTILLIPGWHEKAHDLRTVTHGRPPLPGLAARGFDPRTFELQPDESLLERIDRFAEFIRDLKNREPERFPLALFGYSMGGIVARGLLYRHPELVPDISHIALLATPNWGLPMAEIPALARIVGLPWRELYNIDPEREFVGRLWSSRPCWRISLLRTVRTTGRKPVLAARLFTRPIFSSSSQKRGTGISYTAFMN